MNPEEQSYFLFTLTLAIILVTVVSFATIIHYKSKSTQSTKVIDTYIGRDIIKSSQSNLIVKK